MNARWNVDDVDDGEDIDVDDDGYHDGRSVGDLNAGLSVVALTIAEVLVMSMMRVTVMRVSMIAG